MTGSALFNEVFFDDVFIQDKYVVGQVDNGWNVTRTALASERVAPQRRWTPTPTTATCSASRRAGSSPLSPATSSAS